MRAEKLTETQRMNFDTWNHFIIDHTDSYTVKAEMRAGERWNEKERVAVAS